MEIKLNWNNQIQNNNIVKAAEREDSHLSNQWGQKNTDINSESKRVSNTNKSWTNSVAVENNSWFESEYIENIKIDTSKARDDVSEKSATILDTLESLFKEVSL